MKANQCFVLQTLENCFVHKVASATALKTAANSIDCGICILAAVPRNDKEVRQITTNDLQLGKLWELQCSSGKFATAKLPELQTHSIT